MATEIELKLRFDPQDTAPLINTLNALADYQGRASLRNHYYDTPAAELSAAGCALRIRQKGESWEQTLKTKGKSMAGLQQRGEWNWPLTADQLDTSLFAETDVQRHWPGHVDPKRLLPLFGTHFERSVWIWQQQGNRIEVVIDQGQVTTGMADGTVEREGNVGSNRQQPLCEIELELQQGTPDSLWQLAQQLTETVPLWISDISKAERGYRLAIAATNWSPDWRQHEQTVTLEALNTVLTCLKRTAEAVLWSNSEDVSESCGNDVQQGLILLSVLDQKAALLSASSSLRTPLPSKLIETLRHWLNRCQADHEAALSATVAITDINDNSPAQALLLLAHWAWLNQQSS